MSKITLEDVKIISGIDRQMLHDTRWAIQLIDIYGEDEYYKELLKRYNSIINNKKH